PDVHVPFLGVHITRGVDGTVTLGPTAIPALGRENYGLLDGLEVREAARMALVLTRMFAGKASFRGLVLSELARYTKKGFLGAARALAPSIRAEDILPSDKVGIRAQLLDRRTMELVMDFVVEKGPRSLHVLNAISPAFTSSLAFAEFVVDQIEGA
ncbi:MAG TPA: L-2-hydroxyglutarate oxidase, partial [Candidatus Thermoplasmatota archaeon]